MSDQNDIDSVLRHYRRGTSARAAGNWNAAKDAFILAERELGAIIARTLSPELREERNRFAGVMAKLRKDSEAAAAENRPAPDPPAPSAQSDDPTSESAPEQPPPNVPVIQKGSKENGERAQQLGLNAFRAGKWVDAETYFRQAAGEFLALSKGSKRDGHIEEIRAVWLERAKRLLQKADEAAAAAKENRRPVQVKHASAGKPSEQSSEADGEASAQQWIVKEKPSIRFADVAGLESVKEDIRLKMIYPFDHPELAEKFGIKPGGGVLMYGPPGTGKTMLAKATAGEIDATFFIISPADVLSKWVGEAEQNIKKLFAAAAAEKRSIIFIDEIEALVPARRDDGSSVMQRVVPQILQGVEGFDRKSGRSVLLMGATNVPWQLDPAMLRPGRFDEKIYIPLPDLPARRKMLEIYLCKRPLATNVDLDALAENLKGHSGADIKHFCDRAATIPFLRSVATGAEGEITAEVLAEVLNEVQPSVKPDQLARFIEWGKATE
jgi:transitional endoplasmic reticulum ATPase